MKIGFHAYGTQLSPATGNTGGAAGNAGTDIYRLVQSGIGGDFLLVGGGPVEDRSDLGRASQLIVPWAAASLCVAAPGTEIITSFNAWAFDPAHVARLGANLHALSGQRWALHLDGNPAFWPQESAGHDTASIAGRMREFLDIVHQHWQGRAEFAGEHLKSTGRIVGPRPGSIRPALWRDAGCDQIPADGVIRSWSDAPTSVDGETLLTCAVVLGRNAAEARAIAGEFRGLSDGNCLIGDADHVGKLIVDRLRRQPVGRLAIGLPSFRAIEAELLRERLAPMLRTVLE